MKCLNWLVVLAFLATLTVPSEAFSRAQAFSYTDPAGGGEELHPWGGEDDFGNSIRVIYRAFEVLEAQ